MRVLAHNLAQPDKGTGAAMVCTFGDVTDVTWWRELSLGVRVIIGRDGRLLAAAPEGLSETGAALYTAELAGKSIRCPGCGTAVLVPGRDDGPAAPPSDSG